MIWGAVIGLIGAVVPEVLKLVKDKSDKKFEKEMLEIQLKYNKEMSELRMAEIKAMMDMERERVLYEYGKPMEVKLSGKGFIDGIQVVANFLIMSVRPIITYLVVVCWIILKIEGFERAGSLGAVWSDFDNEFIAAVLFFWFGGRAIRRSKEG